MRRHAPGCNGTVIAFSCTVVYPLCGCGVLWTCPLAWRRHNAPLFSLAPWRRGTANTTSVNLDKWRT